MRGLALQDRKQNRQGAQSWAPRGQHGLQSAGSSARDRSYAEVDEAGTCEAKFQRRWYYIDKQCQKSV